MQFRVGSHQRVKNCDSQLPNSTFGIRRLSGKQTNMFFCCIIGKTHGGMALPSSGRHLRHVYMDFFPAQLSAFFDCFIISTLS